MSRDMAVRVGTYLSGGHPRRKQKLDFTEFRCNHNPKHSNHRNPSTSHTVHGSHGRPLWTVEWVPCMKREAVDHMQEAHGYDYKNRPRPSKGSKKSQAQRHGGPYSSNPGTPLSRGVSQQMAPSHQAPSNPASTHSVWEASSRSSSYDEEEEWEAQHGAPSNYSNWSRGVASLHGMGPPPSMHGSLPGEQQWGPFEGQTRSVHHNQAYGESQEAYGQYPNATAMWVYQSSMPVYRGASHSGMDQQSARSYQTSYAMGAGPPSTVSTLSSDGTIVDWARQMTSAQHMEKLAEAMREAGMAQMTANYAPQCGGGQPVLRRPQFYNEPTPPDSYRSHS
ncbi:hypothetical protein KVR01_012008 [Diaporthe batatas]|uniref:uncharacterized protein n=1 Tax=Diaporthe batatas TaxID=748121 RepID=UPI001D04DDB5|nr:uncharacterized protein KVR01_012008 [Diaporthe batatas]KAG8158247.1 hypothetical protein KVR01_012008 [Diaporthe batatas]